MALAAKRLPLDRFRLPIKTTFKFGEPHSMLTLAFQKEPFQRARDFYDASKTERRASRSAAGICDEIRGWYFTAPRLPQDAVFAAASVSFACGIFQRFCRTRSV